MPVVRSLQNFVRSTQPISNNAVLRGNTSGQVQNSLATISSIGALVVDTDLNNGITNPLLIRRGRTTDVGVVNDNARLDVAIQDAAGNYQTSLRLTTVMTDADSHKTRVDFLAFDTTSRTILAMYADGAPGLQLLSGVTLRRFRGGSATQDVGSIAAGAIATFNMSVPGAVVGDVVAVGCDVNLDNALILSGKVSAADTITIQLFNSSGSAIDPPSATYRAIAIGF